MNSFTTESSMRDVNRAHIDQSVSNNDLTVIVSNLREDNSEDTLTVARSLTNALGDDVSRHVTVTDAQRLPWRVRGKPRLMKIAYESVDQKVRVLRANTKLKEHAEYRRVFLRSSKSHTERLLELNAKTILSELPNGHLYRVSANGRILKKDDPHTGRPATENASA